MKADWRLMMPGRHPSHLLLITLIFVLLFFPLGEIVRAQSTEKSPAVQPSGQSNQQSLQGDSLVQTQQEVRERNQRKALTETLLLNQQVIELYKQGRYDAAIPLAEQALAIREKELCPE